MPSYNKIILIGNLTRDPEMRYLPSQMAVVNFGLAINHRYKTSQGEKREEVCFVDCTAFGKTGEAINQYCQKGKALLIEGRLKFETWEDKQGGGKRSKHVVMVDSFQFISSKQDDSEGDDAPAPRTTRTSERNVENPISADKKFEEDEIPFRSLLPWGLGWLLPA